MVSYLSDSNQVQVYDGAAWAQVSGGNTSPNVIINGAFEINQRGFTSLTTGFTYGFDRWQVVSVDGTVTYSSQAFSPGAAPDSGYEGTSFARLVSTGQTAASARASLRQLVEDVRSFAGQTVTVSFWAKAASGTPKIAVELAQNFGTAGSSTVNNYAGQVTLSTTFSRYTLTFSLPSVSGKTIGSSSALGLVFFTSAGSDFNARTGSLGIQSNTIDIWGVQLEAGSVATPFRRNANSLQGELAACQRYYYRQTSGAAGQHFANGNNQSTTVGAFLTTFPVAMRIAPTALDSTGNAGDYSIRHQATNTTNSAVPAHDSASTWGAIYTFTVASGLTAGNGSFARPVNSTAYLAWSAEL
jgi:hypothetical protein